MLNRNFRVCFEQQAPQEEVPKTNILITPFHNFVNENLSFVLSSVYYENDLEIKIDTAICLFNYWQKWVSSDELLSLFHDV